MRNAALYCLFLLLALGALACTGEDQGSAGIEVVPLEVVASVEAPLDTEMLPSRFVISGWAVDASGGPAHGPGVAAVEIWEEACDVEAGGSRLGVAEYGIPRPDISKMLGLDQSYEHAGFNMEIALRPGAYDLKVCIRGLFSAEELRIIELPVTVAPGQIGVFAPKEFAIVKVPFKITGWAYFSSPAASPGVSSVAVVEGSCSDGREVVRAEYGQPRPAIQEGFRLSEEYLDIGFTAEVVDMEPGEHTLNICAQRAETGEHFSFSLTVNVMSDSQILGIFAPANNDSVPGTFGISGFALDFSGGQGTGPGVERVEVWEGPCEKGSLLAVAKFGAPVPRQRELLGLDDSYIDAGFVATLGALSEGTHVLTVCAHSSPTGDVFGRELEVLVETP